MTRPSFARSALSPRPPSPLPDPSSSNLPQLWRQLPPQQQHLLVSHLATLIRRHYAATNHQKEMDNEQPGVNAVAHHD